MTQAVKGLRLGNHFVPFLQISSVILLFNSPRLTSFSGSLNIFNCRKREEIPTYLIVGGAVSAVAFIVLLILDIIGKIKKKNTIFTTNNNNNKTRGKLFLIQCVVAALCGIFSVAWTITGLLKFKNFII